jgi:uncharacterized protein (DUF1778 family)
MKKNLEIPEKLNKQIKIAAANLDMSANDFVLSACIQKLKDTKFTELIKNEQYML